MRVHTRRAHGLLVAGVCVVLLAGCTGDADPESGSTTAETSAPAPDPTVTSGDGVPVQDLSDPELGIVFVNTPSSLEPPAAAAYNAAARFEVEYWRARTGGDVDPAYLATIPSPDLAGLLQYSDQSGIAGGFGYDGTLRVELSVVDVDDYSASVAACSDYTDVLFVPVDGSAPQTLAESGMAQTSWTTTHLTSMTPEIWVPDDVTFEDGAC